MISVLVVGLLINAIALPLAGRRVWFLYRVISSGQPAPDRIEGVTSRVGAALKRQLVEVLGQKKLLKWSVPGAAHFFVFWAFLILATVYLEAYAILLSRNPEWSWFAFGNWAVLGFLQDFITMMCFFGILTFFLIRMRNAPKALGRRSRFFGSHLSGAWITLFMIFNVLWTLLLFRGAVEARDMGTGHGYGKAAFLSYLLGKVLPDSTTLIGIGLLLHIGVMLVFLIFVLNSKHLHIFVAPLNVLFGRQPVALGAAKPMMSEGKPLTLDDLEDLDEDAKLGVGAAEDFSWKGILDMTTCTECGRCQDQCPAWNTEKPLSPKLLIMSLRDHTLAKAPYLLAEEGKRDGLLEGDAKLAREVERPLVGDTGDEWFYMPEDGSAVIDPDVLWSCVTCGACVQQCPVDIEHVDHIVDMRRYQVLVESNFPAELNGLFKGMENKGNPWNMSPTARMDWAKDLPFEVKVVGEDIESLDEVDWLFWVGCAGAYEDRAKKTTRAVAELLDMAGVSFGVLGNGETCTGDSARRAGNEFVFQGLAAQNIETFKEYKVKKVVSTCAHCFNTLKNEYKQLGIELDVVHHTQLLNQLVREKRLTPVASNGGPKRSITYHDPCYIGRHNQVYSPPRELLSVIPDAELTEMPRNSERSFCCGAGGARMWMEETIGARINETRTAEAVATGADQIAVGCPFCRVMLSDGLTSQQSKGEAREEVEVLDVAQMLLASIKGEAPAQKKAEKKAEKKAAAAAPADAPAAKAEDTTAGSEGSVATKAEPEEGDVTQTEDTVTETSDVGPAAKASGGSSLFDLGGDSEAPKQEAPTEEAPKKEAPEQEAPAASASTTGAGSLFDLGGDSDTAAEETKPAVQASAEAEQPSQPEPSTASSTSEAPATAVPEGGSLFDLEAPEAPAAEPTSSSAPEAASGEDAAADSTTDGSVDRSADAADTSVPGSGQDAEAQAESEAEPKIEAEPEAGSEAGAQPSSSGAAATPATEVPTGGSLFDIEAPTEDAAPTPTTPSPAAEDEAPAASDEGSTEAPQAQPVGEDAAADSTTDGSVDRSQDAADSDVAPGEESGVGGKYPSGTSMFDSPDAQASESSSAGTGSGSEGAASKSAGANEAGPVTSLRDIKAKYADDSSAASSSPADSAPAEEQATADETGTEDVPEGNDAPVDSDATETPETQGTPATQSSAETHQPKTDAEIKEGGSLFDL